VGKPFAPAIFRISLGSTSNAGARLPNGPKLGSSTLDSHLG
jgi:hypothetical protein